MLEVGRPLIMDPYNAQEVFGAYIVGQDPSDSKSSRLHVDIFRFAFIHLRYIFL
jgi:hypothetical protein